MTIYEELIKIQKEYSTLTYQNKGCDYLDKDKLTNEEKEVFKRVEDLLKETIEGFVKFNNFKIYQDGNIVVRVQYQWSEMFTGVGYFPLSDFRKEINPNDKITKKK